MTCGKKTYRSRKDAKKALRDLNRTALTKDKKMTDVYLCEECLCWHVTGLAKARSRKLKAKRR